LPEANAQPKTREKKMKIRFHRKKILKLAIATALILGGQTASASLVSIANYSFEDPTLSGVFSTTAIGWVVTGNSGTLKPTFGKLNQGPTNGSQVGWSNNVGLGLSQILSDKLTANIQYTLMVDVLSRTDGYSHISSILQLRTADDTVLASASIGAIAGGNNGLLTATYLASASDPNLGKNLKIALLAGGSQSDWDNVRLDATPSAVLLPAATPSAVPLPAAMWLFLSGLLGFLGIKRKS
jgi:hypothetical protein